MREACHVLASSCQVASPKTYLSVAMLLFGNSYRTHIVSHRNRNTRYKNTSHWHHKHVMGSVIRDCCARPLNYSNSKVFTSGDGILFHRRIVLVNNKQQSKISVICFSATDSLQFHNSVEGLRANHFIPFVK